MNRSLTENEEPLIEFVPVDPSLKKNHSHRYSLVGPTKLADRRLSSPRKPIVTAAAAAARPISRQQPRPYTPTSLGTLNRRFTNHHQSSHFNVIKPDSGIVHDAWRMDTALLEGMTFSEKEYYDWETFANDFCLKQNGKRIKTFVEVVQQAKIDTERKLRVELDQKIMMMPQQRLHQALGRDFVTRIRHYIKQYYAEEEQGYLSTNSDLMMSPVRPPTLASKSLKSLKSQMAGQLKNQPISPTTTTVVKKSLNGGSQKQKDEDTIWDSREEIMNNLIQLRKVARLVEKRVPMLMYQTEDDIQQLKRFIQVYYGPILSKLDTDQLNEALKSKQVTPPGEEQDPNKQQNRSSKHIERPKLEDPKDPKCTKVKEGLKAELVEKGAAEIDEIPKRTRFNNKQQSREEMLSQWAFFEQKRFEYLGANLKFLKESTCQSEREHSQIRRLIESQKRTPKRPRILPIAELAPEDTEVAARNTIPLRQILTKQKALELKARKSGQGVVANRTQSKSGFNFFDIGGNQTPYNKDLEEYMEKRSSVLSSRYGDQGKGFHHQREKKERQKHYIPSLETPVSNSFVRTLTTRSTQRKKGLKKVNKSLERTTQADESSISSNQLTEDVGRKKERKGYSFLSRMPQMCNSIDDILNKTKPISPVSFDTIVAMRRSSLLKLAQSKEALQVSRNGGRPSSKGGNTQEQLFKSSQSMTTLPNVKGNRNRGGLTNLTMMDNQQSYVNDDSTISMLQPSFSHRQIPQKN